ncbi:sigma-70 family RNA polymerase sigma factor [Bryobacter aggregatus]|uniref:sigma-70 family RNA polymerase sigma factor n=1 Tax=Bryobacter aggregatus TaxID=360054 RepID=UPI00138E1BF7|nr:sigma-70 family RNA polymerase sigma factor [Bryobacter aggregatus]
MADGEITQLLQDWAQGDKNAFEELVPAVYEQLHRIAGGLMRRERSDHTLQATALLHEFYFRLARQRQMNWNDRNHFYTFAAKVMRLILVDHARQTKAQRRGGESVVKVPLTPDLPWFGNEPDNWLDLNRVLDKLGRLDQQKVRIVELRFFLAFTTEEIADLQSVSKSTIDRELRFIRSWLYTELKGEKLTGADSECNR